VPCSIGLISSSFCTPAPPTDNNLNSNKRYACSVANSVATASENLCRVRLNPDESLDGPFRGNSTTTDVGEEDEGEVY